MASHDASSTKHLARTAPGALAVRSSALVARGLRDLARDSNWLIKKVFTGRSQHLAISSAGQVCAISTHVHHGTAQVALYDIELSVPTMALSVPDRKRADQSRLSPIRPRFFPGRPTRAIWWDRGADGRQDCTSSICTANSIWESSANRNAYPGESGVVGFRRIFCCYFARQARVAAGVGATGGPLGGEAAMELATPDWLEPQQAGEEFAEEGSFKGYGRAAFSPNEEALASVIEIKGEWADDSIMVADVKKLSRRTVYGAPGHVTDLTWTPDSEQIIYCAAGQAYRLEPQNRDFGAAAVWRGTMRLPSAFAALRLLQFVAEKFGQGPAVFGGLESRPPCSTNIRRKVWPICDGARTDRKPTP